MRDKIKIKLLQNLLDEITNKYNNFIETQNKKLEYSFNKSIIDPLTGLYNRGFLLENSDRLFKNSADIETIIVFIDLDNFKFVNDKYGHELGDNTLKEVASIIKDHFDTDSSIIRYGGDEFVIILNSIKNDTGWVIDKLAYLRDKIESRFLKFGISLSYGIARYPIDAKDIFELIQIADKRMYEAKKAKKRENRIDEHKLISFISYIPFITLLLFLALNGMYELYSQYNFYNKRVQKSKEDFLSNNKKIIKKRVEFIINVIEHKDKTLPKEQAQKEILDLVNNAKFSKSEYIFIYKLLNINGGKNFAKMIANPNRKDLIGKVISDDYKDAKGKAFRKEFLKGIKKSGESFTIYYYKKPHSSKISKKISYFKLYKKYNWIVATGIYLDKEKEIVENETKLLREAIVNKTIASAIVSIFILLIAFYVTRYLKSLLIKRFEEYKKDIRQNEKELEAKNSQLIKQLYTDSLTNKNNRNALEKDILQNSYELLILIDIDNFRWINDLYGIEAGNIILKEFASIIDNYKKICNIDYKLYRIGSDQFVLLFEKELEDSKSFAKELQDHIVKKDIKLSNGETLNINTTIGISSQKENLLITADMALNRAKVTKKRFLKFSKDIDRKKKNREFFETKKIIEDSIKNDKIVPFYQPITDKDKNIVKYEALARIEHNGEYLTPAKFLDVSKVAKLYPEISKIVISKSFEKFRNLNKGVSVNISILDIKDENMVQFLEKSLSNREFAKRVTMEILESESIDDIELFNDFIEKMRRLGVKIAIDDFGSGYSTFSNLLLIKPDILKIDASIIKDIDKDLDKQSIVKAIVSASKLMGATTVAEFVSSKEVFEKLKELGIDQYQGYYLGKPELLK